MGYTTDFEGSFSITPPLKNDDRIFLTKLAQTRRMARDVDPLLYGVEGEFYVESTADYGQDFNNPNIINGGSPPRTQPGLWLQWIPTEDGTRLVWDNGEKFYDYIPWLRYLIDKILTPRGYLLDGEVTWQGEENGDKGKIIVSSSIITIKRPRWVEPEWEEVDE